ncbi:hypothetical protein KIN20_019820 [Parelaphostrongylus tenuis]|uniref:Uncharacterized protein n=1 Tax=Parelaphostrongylus tenuis TaxID=148309 RepID=A0AAD5MLL6_PARTN|nr:hypothetical protein KIN20_019820 [Parelaphostrongylus tenuis]
MIERIVSLVDQLNEANEIVETWKARLDVSRLQVMQKDKEHEHPTRYTRRRNREKEIIELGETVKALKGGEDCFINSFGIVDSLCAFCTPN